MIKKWISWINLALMGLAALLFLFSIWFVFSRSSEILIEKVPEEKTVLPKRAFALPDEAYEEIQRQLFDLKFTPMSIQLPDLRRFLLYYGKNGRPDANKEGVMMHFGFNGSKETASIEENKKLYLVYDRSSSPGKYSFSQGNAKTPLWIVPQLSVDEAIVKVGMLDDKGNLVKEPAANAQFNLKAREFPRTGGTWELGNQRVDGTLLARQKARWFGKDKFIERHGGAEYQDLVGKERIDFGEGPDLYSVFVKPGDAMTWTGNQWKVVKPGKDSLGRPLLFVKQVDERLMKLELWDVEGKSSVALNLLKSQEPRGAQNVEKNFKFLGARTRSQFVFEIDNERMLLSPYDWLLLIDGSWKKLTTEEEIDNYVERKTIGPLFVFDGIKKSGDQQFLSGVLFNSSRSDFQAVEIPVQSGGKANKEEPKNVKENEPAVNNVNNRLRQKAEAAAVPQVDGTNSNTKENSAE